MVLYHCHFEWKYSIRSEAMFELSLWKSSRTRNRVEHWTCIEQLRNFAQKNSSKQACELNRIDKCCCGFLRQHCIQHFNSSLHTHAKLTMVRRHLGGRERGWQADILSLIPMPSAFTVTLLSFGCHWGEQSLDWRPRHETSGYLHKQ